MSSLLSTAASTSQTEEELSTLYRHRLEHFEQKFENKKGACDFYIEAAKNRNKKSHSENISTIQYLEAKAASLKIKDITISLDEESQGHVLMHLALYYSEMKKLYETGSYKDPHLITLYKSLDPNSMGNLISRDNSLSEKELKQKERSKFIENKQNILTYHSVKMKEALNLFALAEAKYINNPSLLLECIKMKNLCIENMNEIIKLQKEELSTSPQHNPNRFQRRPKPASSLGTLHTPPSSPESIKLTDGPFARYPRPFTQRNKPNSSVIDITAGVSPETSTNSPSTSNNSPVSSKISSVNSSPNLQSTPPQSTAAYIWQYLGFNQVHLAPPSRSLGHSPASSEISNRSNSPRTSAGNSPSDSGSRSGDIPEFKLGEPLAPARSQFASTATHTSPKSYSINIQKPQSATRSLLSTSPNSPTTSHVGMLTHGPRTLFSPVTPRSTNKDIASPKTPQSEQRKKQEPGRKTPPL